MDEPDDQPPKDSLLSRVLMAAPWSLGRHESDAAPPRFLADFVHQRSKVHETFIIQQARNKRLGLILAFLLILFAAGIVVFAPAGRQSMSLWVGAALVVFAAGAAGYARVWGKTKNMSFGADQDKGDPPSPPS